jgi:hypothetical protein
MIYTVRLTVSRPELQDVCWEDAWCYREPIAALVAFMEWNGTGDDGPPGWNKHPLSGRWREDGTPATERGPDPV